MLDGKIILVDDNEAVLKTLKMILAREFKTLVGVSVPTLLPALLREGDVDIVLLDEGRINQLPSVIALCSRLPLPQSYLAG